MSRVSGSEAARGIQLAKPAESVAAAADLVENFARLGRVG
jgi:hypothetical protein